MSEPEDVMVTVGGEDLNKLLDTTLRSENEIAEQLLELLANKRWLVEHAELFLETLQVVAGVAIDSAGLGVARIPLRKLADMLIDKAIDQVEESKPSL